LLRAVSLVVQNYNLDCHYTIGIRFDETLKKIREDVKKKAKKL